MNKNTESERAAAARLTLALGVVVSRSQVRYWKSRAYDLHDLDGLKHKLRQQERVSESLRPLLSRSKAPEPPKATLAPDSEPEEWPDSIGDIPIEVAAQRELKVLLHLADVVPEILDGLDQKEMRDALRWLALRIYSGTYGEILQNWDEVADTFFPDDADSPESLAGKNPTDSIPAPENPEA